MDYMGVETQTFSEKPLLFAKVYSGRFLCAGKMAYDERGDVINISPENLMKIANTHVGVPVIINHKDVTLNNIEEEKVGYVSRIFFNDKGFEAGGKKYSADNWAWCDFIVEKQHAIDLLDKQGWELSNSYLPVEYPNPNKEYDVEVVAGKGLHLAIVPEGRYETKVVRHNEKKTKNNINLSNKTMSILDNAKQKLLGKRSNSEYKHDNKNAEHVKHEEHKKHAMENYEGKKFRDEETGEEYDVAEVMHVFKNNHTKEFDDNILDLDDEYMIEGYENPISGRHMLEYFKNVKNEKKAHEKHMMHDMENAERNEREENEDEDEDETRLTLEEKIEKEKQNTKHSMHNASVRNGFSKNTMPKSNGFAKVFAAKKEFARSNSVETASQIVSVRVDPQEASKEIFGKNK